MEPVQQTGKKVTIPEQFFFYRVAGGLIVEIRPDPIPGAAPQGILEQIGANGRRSFPGIRGETITSHEQRVAQVTGIDLDRIRKVKELCDGLGADGSCANRPEVSIGVALGSSFR